MDLGGSPNQTLTSGEYTYTNLTATSSEAVLGAYLTFSSGSFASINSDTFDIPVNSTPALSAADGATVDNSFFINFIDDETWRTSISEIRYGGETLPLASYATNGAGRITFEPSQSTFLQAAELKQLPLLQVVMPMLKLNRK